ncbi:MAG: hypothetical protein WC455_09355 [Dehalococcoidia bacterium]|jgi:hypothetical protein
MTRLKLDNAPFRRVPSVKTLEPVFKERSQEAREILQGSRDPMNYESVRKWVESCYHKPRRREIIMEALNVVAETCGVEALWGPNDTVWPSYEYLNAGDSYAPTVIHDLKNKTVRVCSWGDLVERNPKLSGAQSL